MNKLLSSLVFCALLSGCAEEVLYVKYLTQPLPEEPLCEKVPQNYSLCLFKDDPKYGE